MSDFLKIHQNAMETVGFWDELYVQTVIHAIESNYSTEVLREWCIADIAPNGNKFLINWRKRYRPLTDKELESKYCRTDF